MAFQTYVPGIAWISLKTLCSPVMESFADAKLLDFRVPNCKLHTFIRKVMALVVCIHYIRYVHVCR